MKPAPRLFLEGPLLRHAACELSNEQRHYLVNVLRLAPGDPIKVFNATDGEWLGHLATVGKRTATLRCERKTADVRPPPDIDYLFAPLKHARLDYLIQKATELGARRLRPVLTHRTVMDRVNLQRMRANAVEAAEQCNLVFVPELCEPVTFVDLISGWPSERHLVYCDETAPVADPIAALSAISLPAALLVGPEGGFTNDERELLAQVPRAVAISLGPRIIRADTAASAGLALMQSTVGDWHQDR